MKGWVIGCLLLCAWASVQEDCIEVSADPGAESPVVAGMDLAVALTAGYRKATLCLTPSPVPFTLNAPATVTAEVVFLGNRQVINVLTTLRILGSVAFHNVTLTTSLISTEFSIFVLTGGSFRIEDSVVDSLRAALLAGSGLAILERSEFTSNAIPVVSAKNGEDLSLKMLHCNVWNHINEFLDLSTLSHFGTLSVSIEHTSFSGTTGTGFLITCQAPLLTGTFAISDSEFLMNKIPLLFFDIGDIQVSIARCAFLSNNQTTLTVNAKESAFTIEESVWRQNSQIAFDIRQFSGNLTVTRITLTDHRWKGIFQISNSLLPEQCHFTLHESTFLDTYSKVNEQSIGLIDAHGCMILITRTVISNVRLAATLQRYVHGLILLRLGNLVISEMTLHSSGAVGAGLVVEVGNFRISDSVLYDIQSGLNVYVGTSIGRLSMNNVSISHGAGFPLDDENIGTTPTYITSAFSTMEISDVKVLPGPITTFDYPRLLLAIYSNASISDIVVDGLSFGTIAAFFNAAGVVRNFTILNCFLNSAFFVQNNDLLRISHFVIKDSTVNMHATYGIFYSTPTMNIECDSCSISNVTSRYLVASKKSRIRLHNFTITDSHFQYLLMYQLDSFILIEGMTIRNSTAALASLYRSSLTIADSVFADLASNLIIMEGEEVNITLDSVVMRNVLSPAGISNFKETSRLIISQSAFESVQITAGAGFSHKSGTLNITNSSFRAFNAVIIQASSCSVYIGNSKFQESRSNALSQTSNSAYGGALGCTDCTSVDVEHSTFLNVSAIFGGAIAARTTLGTLWVRISKCEFVGCSATAGGAVYLKQVSLLIEGSEFVGNDAESTGGAIDIYTSREQSARVRNCAFYRNNATEGGAVKWNDAEVAFINATFQDNTAVYAADIASYGVKLLGSVTSSGGSEASGYPLRLVFELQDHYGQRVTTASTQHFQLLSDDQVDFRGNTAATIDHGIFTFSQLTIYTQPNSTQQVSGLMLAVHNRQMTAISASVRIKFRDCVPGEVWKADRCEYCLASNVSFSPADSDCNYCPQHASCPGGSVLIVDPHYMRNSTNSTDIMRCPVSLHCLGGEDSKCAEGYTGQVCNECSEDYSRRGAVECERCSSRLLQLLKVLLIAVPIVGFTATVGAATDVQFFLIKNIINHLQLLSVLNYIRVSFPPAIKYSLQSLSYISLLSITDLPISCFSFKQSEYIKSVIGSAMLPACIILSVLFNTRNLKKAWVICTSAMMFTSAISLSTHMPLVACQTLHSEVEYLFMDMQEKCWEGRHLLLIYALLVPSVLLNVLLPIALVVVVSITSPQRFDDWFPLWRSGVSWRCWDLWVYCGKGVLISFVATAVVAEQLSQVTYGLLVLIIVSVVSSGMNSYAYTHWKLFILAECSIVVVAVSMGLCSYFIYHSPSEGVSDWLITAGFLMLNTGYLAVCVKMWKVSPKLATEEKSPPPNIEIRVPQNSFAESLQGSLDIR